MLRSILGVEWPLIQAPMAGVQDVHLAAAVSNAGALGSLPCAMLSIEGITEQLRLLRQLTHKPINVNFFTHRPPVFDADKDNAWRELVAAYGAKWQLPKPDMATTPLRHAFDAKMLEALSPFKPEVVSFHFGLPDAALLSPMRAWGAKIISTATTVAEAIWLVEQGVDAVIAQGLEAGGHRGHFLQADLDLQGQMPLSDLLPAIVQALRQSGLNVPVIAAGGIATSADVAAMMALGAQGVQAGTAYLLCKEATTSAVHRSAIGHVTAKVAGSPMGKVTALTNGFTGRPARGIVNDWMMALAKDANPTQGLADEAIYAQITQNAYAGLYPMVPAFPLAANALAPLKAAAEKTGSSECSALWAGERFDQCQQGSAAAITHMLCNGFHAFI